MSFYLRHGHPDYHTSSGVSRILGFPNVRFDITDVIYNLVKCQNRSRVQFDSKNSDRTFDKGRVKRERKSVTLRLIFEVLVAFCELSVRA